MIVGGIQRLVAPAAHLHKLACIPFVCGLDLSVSGVHKVPMLVLGKYRDGHTLLASGNSCCYLNGVY